MAGAKKQEPPGDIDLGFWGPLPHDFSAKLSKIVDSFKSVSRDEPILIAAFTRQVSPLIRSGWSNTSQAKGLGAWVARTSSLGDQMDPPRIEPERVREADLAWNYEIETIREISKTLNALLADLFTLFLKTKNFCWHASGPNFPAYYAMFGEQANQLLQDLDLVAERVRKIGGSTIHSVEHVLRLSRLPGNDADTVSPLNMLSELWLDNRRLTEFLRDAHLICADYVDLASASVLQTLIDNAETRAWFLTETMRVT